jgi:Glycosyl transferase family 2
MRVVAVLAVRNEERFVADCLENLFSQGVEVFLCDNGSTDRTVEIAERYRCRGLIGIERIPFDGVYRWEALLRRKEELFHILDADWLMHVDADEIHLPPRSHESLAAALADVDRRGYDTVECLEFTFVPTREAPDHDHPDFQRTMRSYYPFWRRHVRALKKRSGRMEIAWSGGHTVRFATTPRLCPEPFRLRHYLFLSAAHAARKYRGRRYDEGEVAVAGWHGWRARLRPEALCLPGAAELRITASDEDLDVSEPWRHHWLQRCVAPAPAP